ncbi:MAG: SBBP repeat-containing protein, partial [Anaerolineae bacterium]|nr:SBBP repeat-containing protein [Anaerolineae bacterium]
MLRNVFSTSRIVMALLALGLLIAVTALSPAAVGGLQTDGDPWPTTSPDASTDLQAAAELVRANQLTTDHSSPAVQEVDKQIGLETIEALSSNSPVMLIENVGQWDENARFQVWGARGTIWLAEDAIWLTLLGTSQETGEAGEELSVTPEPSSDGDLTEIDASHDVSGVNLKISFLTGDLAPTLEPISLTNTLINYFLGTEPGNWRIGVPTWSGVRYKNIIPDTDADIVISSEQFWQWHLMVPPDAAFGDISIRIDGANDLFVDDNGVLWLDTDVGRIPGPLLLTEDDSPLFVNQIDADVVTFDVQPPEPFNPLGTPSMSPDDNPGELVFSTFFGGSAYDSANAVAAGNVGETYVAGETYSYNFPTTPGAFDPSINGSSDIFIAKLPDFGQSVDFSTFIGGTNQDRANAISVHDDGTIYIVGDTSSYNYPTRSGTFDTSFNGGTDVVVTRLSSSGSSLIFSGYLGGSLGEVGGGIAVDASGAAYVTGQTWSTDFPTSSGAFDRSHNGNTDAFVSKIGPGGGSLVFSTFLGGSTYDFAYGIAVDSRGAPYVVGSTGSASFPTTPGAFNRTFAGFNDVFITRLNPSGSALEYSGLLGGNSDDQGQGIAVDSNGAAYISGQTTSTNFLTTPGAYDRNRSGFWDGFAAKISASGGNLVYSTYIGGNNNDCETSGIDRECVIALNDVGQAYIAGRTFSSDFPTTFDAFDRTYNGSEDGFMAKLNASGSALLYGSFFGGSGGDQTLAVAVDHTESAFVAGRTYSSNFPTNASAFDRTYNGSGDGFIIKLAVGAPPTPTPTRTPTSTPTPTNTSTRTITPTSTNTPANTDTPSPTSSPTLTPTPTRTTGPSVTNTPTPRLPTPTATPDFPICTVTLDKIAYPGTVGINDQVGVTLRLTGDCPGEIGAAVDVALVFDRSQSMCGAKLDEAQAAGQN